MSGLVTFDATPWANEQVQVRDHITNTRTTTDDTLQGDKVYMGLPEWQVAAVKRLKDLEGLPHNWNSYGGDPPAPLAIEAATDFVFNLPLLGLNYPPHVVPVGGGVQLEWDWEGRELELTFFRDQTEIIMMQNGHLVKEITLAAGTNPDPIECIGWLLFGR